MEFELSEIDFRFADDEDAEDIAAVVNRSYDDEVNGPYAFRKPGPKIEAAEIVADCSTPSTRWILLETPRPEELVIAALRIRIIRESTVHALVDILGSARSTAIRNIILIRAEAICRSLGCFKITIEVPSWSEDIQEWLSTCGYEDLGGHMWPEETEHILLKPTLIMEYQKSLHSKDIITTPQHAPVTALPSHRPPPDTAADDKPMKGLIADLFRALHAEANTLPDMLCSDTQGDGQGPSSAEGVCIAPLLSVTEDNDGKLDGVVDALGHVSLESIVCDGDCVTMIAPSLDISQDDEGVIDGDMTSGEYALGAPDDSLTGLMSNLLHALHADTTSTSADVVCSPTQSEN